MTTSLEHPSGLTLELTGRCTRNCRYCYNAWRSPGGPPLPRELPVSELLSLVLPVVRATGRRRVDLTGGEPLLRDDLPDLIQGLRLQGLGVALTTDGGLVDAFMAQVLARMQVSPVQVTLLAADRGLHDELKGSPGAFDQTVEGVAQLTSAGVPVSIAFVHMRPNADRLGEVAELAFALGARSLAFDRLCVTGQAARRAQELVPDEEQTREALRELDRIPKRWPGLRTYRAMSVPQCLEPDGTSRGAPGQHGGCAASGPTPAFCVGADGRVRTCAAMTDTLGDLKHETWPAIEQRWQQTRLHAPVATSGGCAKCSDLDACRMGCRASADDNGVDRLVGAASGRRLATP